MTLEEAKALVLREGMMDKDAPDGLVVMIFHEGHKPASEQMSLLVQAIDTVHEAIEGKAVIELVNAVEFTLIGSWPVGHPRDKEGVTNGDSPARKSGY